MKTSFLPRLVNGQGGDPALFVDIVREKRALLFDCGAIDALSPSEILRISDIFVSHAHIDHFIGFDHALRLHLGRNKRVRVFGPLGITACVRGRLSGYTWNLVQHQRLVYEVHEWNGSGQRVTEFYCRRRFRPEASQELPASDLLWQEDQFYVQSAVLDHKIPSLAYAVTEKDFTNVDPVQLAKLELRPGPWLNELKKRLRLGLVPGMQMLVDNRPYDAAELASQLLIVSRGKKLAYVADAKGSLGNQEAIVSLAKDADLMFCEGAFLDADAERANETCHLTARMAGELARKACAKRLVIFHFSPKYERRFAELEAEAAAAFETRGES